MSGCPGRDGLGGILVGPMAVNAIDKIAWPLFHFVEYQPYIFAQKAQEKELNSTKQANRSKQGCPARNAVVSHQIKENLDDAAGESQDGAPQANADADGQGGLGKRQEAIERKSAQTGGKR